jgi:hypothetical protein
MKTIELSDTGVTKDHDARAIFKILADRNLPKRAEDVMDAFEIEMNEEYEDVEPSVVFDEVEEQNDEFSVFELDTEDFADMKDMYEEDLDKTGFSQSDYIDLGVREDVKRESASYNLQAIRDRNSIPILQKVIQDYYIFTDQPSWYLTIADFYKFSYLIRDFLKNLKNIPDYGIRIFSVIFGKMNKHIKRSRRFPNSFRNMSEIPEESITAYATTAKRRNHLGYYPHDKSELDRLRMWVLESPNEWESLDRFVDVKRFMHDLESINFKSRSSDFD